MKKDIGLALMAAKESGVRTELFLFVNSFPHSGRPDLYVFMLTHSPLHFSICIYFKMLRQAPLPLGDKAMELYEAIHKAGLGGMDFSIVYDYLSKNSK